VADVARTQIARGETLPDPTIEGEVVSLRCWEPADAPALEAACGRPEICSFTTVPLAYTRQAACEWIACQDARRRDGTSLVLAVVHEDGPPVGTIWIFDMHDAQTPPRVGCWIVPAWRGRGVCGAALALLARWAPSDLGIERFLLEIHTSNAPSIRVAERSGARRIGHFQRFEARGPVGMDCFELDTDS
jgi:[ribosomal protein S5]-alanine N-acetyltransferase